MPKLLALTSEHGVCPAASVTFPVTLNHDQLEQRVNMSRTDLASVLTSGGEQPDSLAPPQAALATQLPGRPWPLGKRQFSLAMWVQLEQTPDTEADLDVFSPKQGAQLGVLKNWVKSVTN